MSTSEFSQVSNSERSASVDADQVEQAKREIQGLVQEIAELSRTEVDSAAFYNAILNKVVAALAAPGGAVWTLADTGALQLAYQINLQQTGLAENQLGQQQHGRLLHQVMHGSEGALVAPHSGTGDATDSDADAAANPTDFLLVLAPMHNDLGPQGVLEVFQRPGTRIGTQRGYLRFLLQVCEFVGDYLKAGRLRHLSDKQTLWEQLETFTRSAHEKLDVRQTAYTIANEGRRLIGCDRVSVAIRRGGRCPIEAVSGQDSFDKRSNVVVMLGKLAAAVAKTGEDVWFTGDTTNLAPQVENALDAYIDESNTKAMAILPISKPRDEESQFAEGVEPEPPEIIGALIVEQLADSRTPEGFTHRVGVVRTHSSTALTNALEYEGLFLMPVWRFLGKGTKLFRGRTLPKTLAAIGAALTALALLCFYPVELKLEGDGKLRPKVRKNVWAEVNGEIHQVNVEHDQPVRKDEVILVQHSPDLEKEIAALDGELHRNEAKLLSTQRELDDNDELSEVEVSQREREINELSETIKSLRAQIDIQQRKREKLQIRSPIDGRVVTWNVEERLLGRPVNAGENLLEVADPKQDWELEVLMPEKRMGHIAKAAFQNKQPLPVTFFLATNPSQEFDGTVEEVQLSAEVRGEEGNTVLVRVAFDQPTFRSFVLDPKIGAGATAKIHCGKRSIGYVWFHDLVDFIRAKILFRFF
ncbi:MAG: HlyD family efflux transporter periplasmic adaptor subunit [Pirellulales bacterium]|nr:HlyD family efflux transporter periplasmic adaptor subunit [Pirellulales bacterium]